MYIWFSTDLQTLISAQLRLERVALTRSPSHHTRVLTLPESQSLSENWQPQELSSLEPAKTLGEVLLPGLNEDTSRGCDIA